MADFRLLDRKVINGLLSFPEQGLFLRGLVQWVGFSSTVVEFDCVERYAGTSKYTLRKMIRLAWSGVTSFSLVPLRLGIALGVVTSGVAFAGIVYAVVGWLTGNAVPGWASAVSIISFLFGVLFILLGLIGEYIGRTLVP